MAEPGIAIFGTDDMSSELAPASIRQATAADSPALAALRYEFRAALAEPRESAAAFQARCARWMATRLAAHDGWWAWVAVRDSEILGTVWLHRVEKLPNPVLEAEAYGYITNLFVVPHARNAGTGGRLLRTALRHAEQAQFDTVILWPTPRSRRLYESHGFTAADGILARSTRLGQLPSPNELEEPPRRLT